MSTELATAKPTDEAIERVLIQGDLSALTPPQRLAHYKNVCESLGLNPLTQPLDYLKLSGKIILYAKKDATDQLRKLHGVSIVEMRSEHVKDVYVVTVKAADKTGRTDAATGVVALGTLKGDALANALMKAETKAKRRVTLSICGLGWLDESELETVRGAEPMDYTVTATPPAVVAPEPIPAPAEAMPEYVPGDTPLKIVAVSVGSGAIKARVKFSDGQEFPVYSPKLATLCETLVQEGCPVTVTLKTSASGNERLDDVKRLDSVAPVDAPPVEDMVL